MSPTANCQLSEATAHPAKRHALNCKLQTANCQLHDPKEPSPLVLLDRDGTLILDQDYLSDPAGVELLPGAVAGLKRFQAAGYRLALVTNQSGIARGYFTHETLARIHQRLIDLLATEGVTLDGIYYCPHEPKDHCNCRKPLPGLALQAAAALNGDLTRSIVIGDKPADIGLARVVGAKAILVRTGYGKQYDFSKDPKPDFVADSLVEAAEWCEGWRSARNY